MHPKLLTITPEEVRRLVGPIDPDMEQQLQSALQAVLDHKEATSAALQATIRGVSSHRVAIYECASCILEDLASFDISAMDAIAELSKSPDASVRHNALLCLNNQQPSARVQVILTAALSDKSSRVRRKAADWLGRLKLRELLPVLRTALEAERHDQTRFVMSAEVARLQSAGFGHSPHTAA